MRKTLLSLLLSFFIGISLLLTPAITSASGTTTSSNQNGQVIVRDENGVIYLTTATNQTSTKSGKLMISDIVLPKGFSKSIAAVINSVMSLVMLVAGLMVLMYLIWGAIDWLTSGGDKGKIESARQKIMAAVVGLIILSASYAITLLALRFLGFKDLNDVFNNVQSIDGKGQVFNIAPSTPLPKPSATPTTKGSTTYSDNLGEVMAR